MRNYLHASILPEFGTRRSMLEVQHVSRYSSSLKTRPLESKTVAHSLCAYPETVVDFCIDEQIEHVQYVSFGQSEQSMHRHARMQQMRMGVFVAVPQVATGKNRPAAILPVQCSALLLVSW